MRIKFKNGTEGEFQELSAFGHDDAVPVTEFIYRLEVRMYAERHHYHYHYHYHSRSHFHFHFHSRSSGILFAHT